ncbi:MAG: hypothetical protein H6Q89_3519 [Myxococcaceae bacterium]|nr:hypothetical protein [Myxococcaceae bacterium]
MAHKEQLPPPAKYADAPTWRGNSHDIGSRISEELRSLPEAAGGEG